MLVITEYDKVRILLLLNWQWIWVEAVSMNCKARCIRVSKSLFCSSDLVGDKSNTEISNANLTNRQAFFPKSEKRASEKFAFTQIFGNINCCT